jgi:hypothetical protein
VQRRRPAATAEGEFGGRRADLGRLLTGSDESRRRAQPARPDVVLRANVSRFELRLMRFVVVVVVVGGGAAATAGPNVMECDSPAESGAVCGRQDKVQLNGPGVSLLPLLSGRPASRPTKRTRVGMARNEQMTFWVRFLSRAAAGMIQIASGARAGPRSGASLAHKARLVVVATVVVVVLASSAAAAAAAVAAAAI